MMCLYGTGEIGVSIRPCSGTFEMPIDKCITRRQYQPLSAGFFSEIGNLTGFIIMNESGTGEQFRKRPK